MNAEQLKELGLSPKKLGNRIVARCAKELLSSLSFGDDPDDPPARMKSDLAKRIEAKVKERVDLALDTIAVSVLGTEVERLVSGMVFKTTNSYGEPKGPDRTLIEYITSRIDEFLNDKVDYSGKTAKEHERAGNSSYHFKAVGTRLSVLIGMSIEEKIKASLTAAVTDINNSIAGGLVELTKMKMAEIAASLKVAVTVR